jgi:hypothetical protein
MPPIQACDRVFSLDLARFSRPEAGDEAARLYSGWPIV